MALVNEDVLRSKFCQEYNMGSSDPFEALDNALENTPKVEPQRYIIAGSPTPEMEEMFSNCDAIVVSDDPTIEPVSQWISVKDRLPPEMDKVLVASKPKETYYIDFAWWTGHGWYRGYRKSSYKNVTHWMPLPEPPEVEA